MQLGSLAEVGPKAASWPVLLFGLCLAALAFRVTLGVDLGDEAYYAAFIDGWLKDGLGKSPFLMVHQTADLVVYPLALLYRAMRGNADGLVLFLRLLYLTVSALSAACLYRAIAPYRGRALALLAALFSLLFIPFSLPAPSYNTIGMMSLVGALSLFAAGISQASPQRLEPAWAGLPRSLWFSGLWWAVACVAYPPMLAPLMAALALSLVALRNDAQRSLVRRYAVGCGALLAIAFLMLCAALGPAKLMQMLRFTNAFNNVSGGVGGKLQTAIHAFAAHRRFALICIAALLVGGARCLRSPKARLLSDVALGLLVVGVWTSEMPTFFSRAHDLVLVLALTGICVAFRQMVLPDADGRTRMFAVVCGASFIGGLATAAAAFNGLFNFPIGGFLAACLALVLPAPGSLLQRAVRLCVMALACAAMAATTFTTYYGQIDPLSYKTSVRVSHGAFAGLRTDPDQATFMARMTDAIERQRACGSRFAVIGTGPGFYLLTTMSPTALSTWNFPGEARNFATEAVESFYREPANQPDVLVVNNWQWATPLSTSDRALLEKYTLAERVRVGIRDASVYRRTGCAG